MKRKRILLVALATMLILPSFLVNADKKNDSQNSSILKAEKEQSGVVAAKDEVVYATMTAKGELEQIYVVNLLEVQEEGVVVDFGNYESVKNLTNVQNINLDNDKIQLKADKGKFYYQGNMDETMELPWKIAISYELDEVAISPESLPGKSGRVQIKIETSANEKIDPIFYENYLLQVSVTLDSERFTNIETNGGLIANAGRNKQITFTVLPNEIGEMIVTADVNDFEMQGIDIAAVPSTMGFDIPEIDEMTGDMKSLAEAIQDLHEGVNELNKGVKQLNDGVVQLRNGSTTYRNGVTELDQSSQQLIEGSNSIKKALETISQSLNSSSNDEGAGVDLTSLAQLPEGLLQISEGLNETGEGLTTLNENFSVAFNTLDEKMNDIPSYQITEEQINELYQSTADKKVIEQLLETYLAAQTVKGTYDAVKQGFTAVMESQKQISTAIYEMSSSLSNIAQEVEKSMENMDGMDSFTQLEEGLTELAKNYTNFHSGLVSYTEGVGKVATGYEGIHSGIVGIAEGTAELSSGVNELRDGTAQLADSTKDLPVQMQQEVDKMVKDFDKSNFTPVSFVSSKNDEMINSVQFVIKTEAIKKEVEKRKVEIVEEKKGFWDKLKDLFIK